MQGGVGRTPGCSGRVNKEEVQLLLADAGEVMTHLRVREAIGPKVVLGRGLGPLVSRWTLGCDPRDPGSAYRRLRSEQRTDLSVAGGEERLVEADDPVPSHGEIASSLYDPSGACGFTSSPSHGPGAPCPSSPKAWGAWMLGSGAAQPDTLKA